MSPLGTPEAWSNAVFGAVFWGSSMFIFEGI